MDSVPLSAAGGDMTGFNPMRASTVLQSAA